MVVGHCLVKLPLRLGDIAQLVIIRGRVVIIASRFEDLEGFLVVGHRLVKLPLLLGDYAQVVIGNSNGALYGRITQGREFIQNFSINGSGCFQIGNRHGFIGICSSQIDPEVKRLPPLSLGLCQVKADLPQSALPQGSKFRSAT